ncbi:regulator of chromosome condensation 1/beta-lactamase-inhibitor protein II [Microdochium trichocladiopsis]|uniref:Regulator of chromosome condensation 1/beta-lactamase-inhibitor protein II n=1 Tax=Microdochium trichocladiopsis TaxID=1682393 RepID=A0A9P8XUU0_9PEZI|nr:regulator of chromosome condensation 1/beta-lactamase-inhibitor protein II [Microdochium trichocladiopsis]KAH7016349.1 regulator of chromosome condensation 1/beta-lactamase-inhibitor protein II [Microdochium trichocladiopsis]
MNAGPQHWSTEQAGQQGHDGPSSWEDVALQSFSSARQLTRYWVVDAPIPHQDRLEKAPKPVPAVEPGPGPKWEADIEADLVAYEAQIATEDAERARKVDYEPGVDFESPWVRQMGWAAHLAGKDMAELRRAAQPGLSTKELAKLSQAVRKEREASESALVRLGQSFDREIDRCRASTFNAQQWGALEAIAKALECRQESSSRVGGEDDENDDDKYLDEAVASQESAGRTAKGARLTKTTRDIPATTSSSSRRAGRRPIINEAPHTKLDVFVFGEGVLRRAGPRQRQGINDNKALARDTTWSRGTGNIDEEDDEAGGSEDYKNINPRESTPGEIDYSVIPKDSIFTQVDATDSASFAVTDEGDVYGWGTFRGADGVIGFSPSVDTQPTPALIPVRRIKKLSCSANHVLALDEAGKTGHFGNGSDHATIPVPTRVETLADYRGRVDGHQVGISGAALNKENTIYNKRAQPQILFRPTIIKDIATTFIAVSTDTSFAIGKQGYVFS